MHPPAIWKRIPLDSFRLDVTHSERIVLEANCYGEAPIVLSLNVGDYDYERWLTPAQARALATKLIEMAVAFDAAGKNPAAGGGATTPAEQAKD